MSDALEKLRDEFVNLFVLDVEEYGIAYKECIREQPTLWALRMVAQADEREVRNMIANLRAERRKVEGAR